MADNSIYDTLTAHAPGNVLALPAATFGMGPFQDVVSATCDGGILRANVQIEATDAGAHLTGTGSNAPFAGMQIDATFVPYGGSVGMTLVATSATAWDLANGWPVLAGSFAQQLGMSNASLTLGTGTPGQATKGLAFQGTAALGSLTPWGPISWLLADLASIQLTGPIGTASSVPVFDWTAPITTSVTVPGLGELHPTLHLSCAAVANPSGQPPFGPLLGMALGATVPLGPGIPVTVDVSNPSGLIPVEADPSAITSDVLDTIGDFVGQQLGSFMPSGTGFNPGSVVTLRQIGFMVSPAQKSVTSGWFELGTPIGTHWPVADHVDIQGIGLQVVVPFGTAGKYASPFVTAFGNVTLPGGGLDISGSYSDRFMLAAGLTDGSHVKVTDLLDLFLPTPVDADLWLNELDMTAVPGSGAWSLATDLTGDWGVDVGAVRIALTEAGLSLAHDPTDSPPTSGTIMATAVIGGDTSGNFTFSGTWTLPETFVLTGTFPDVDLSALAAKLTGNGAPAGAPTVELTQTTATLELQPADSTYDFSMSATAATSTGTTLGQAAFDVRKDTTGFGFLIGFDLPVGWSPGQLWSPLDTLFSHITFENSGMVISTLANTSATLATLHMPSVPATVGRGVTFFTSLKLDSGALGFLGELLPSGTELDLLGMVDTDTPANSTITAELTEPASQNALQIKDVKLSIQPATTKVTATIDALITVGSGNWAEPVTISGGGSLVIEPEPDIGLFVDVKNWSEPFGIQHLVVDDFGLRVDLDATGVLNTNVVGEVTIGQGDDEFSLSLEIGFADFEVPDSLVFNLQPQQGKTLMLPSLIAAFVPSLDLSKVPVLNEIGFKALEFYMIEDPAGIKIGDYTYPQGIGLDCDVVLYSWEIKLCVEVSATNGIKASGSVNQAIDLFGVLSLTDATGTTGPSASIDTAGLMSTPASTAGPVKTQALAVAPTAGADPPAYLCLDGKVQLLGVSYTLECEVTKTSFDFLFEFQFLSALKACIHCSLVDDKNFSGDAEFDFDLDMTLGPWMWGEIELMPAVPIQGPTGSVRLAVVVNPTVIFSVAFGLVFDWGSVHVSIAPSLTAAELANDLENLWGSVETWMQHNLDEVFAELKADVTKWAQAIADGLFEIEADADDVANAVKNFFDAGFEDAASVLTSLDYEFTAAAEALVKWFGVSMAEAAEALGDAVENCAMDSANAALESGDGTARPRGADPALFGLTASPKGQRLLFHWYAHEEELRRLAGQQPAGTNGDGDGTIEVGVLILIGIRDEASPELRDAIDEALPELERRREMAWDEFVEDLAR